MRRIFISLFTLLSCSLMAQVTLQHTFVGRNYTCASYDYSSMTSLIYSESTTDLYGSAYYQTVFDTTSYTITQYGTNYELISTRVFNIPVIPGYYASSCQITKSIFDDDPNTYEVLVSYRWDSKSGNLSDRNMNAKALAYREDGTIVADFGNACYIYVYPYLHVYDREYRILVSKENCVVPVYNYNDPQKDDVIYSYDVYKVNKRNASGLQQVPAHDMPRKVMHDGKVFIIAGDRVIDVLGRDVR